MSSKFPKRQKIFVSDHHIDEGKCRDTNKCMVKLAIKEAIGGHGYVNVDGGIVSITRRSDYREKGMLPRSVREKVCKFDRLEEARRQGRQPAPGDEVKPFSFWIDWIKTTPIRKETAAQRVRANERMDERKAAGWKKKDYSLRKRIVGMAANA